MQTLRGFITTHRQELIDRARAKVALRLAPRATTHELTNGVPLFLTQLANILEEEAAQSQPNGSEMGVSATQHGQDMLRQGFSIAQVVHDYGDLCQAITELALHLGVPIATEDFHSLNRCLDNAIASAVTEYARQHEADESTVDVRRRGFFAHEFRNHLNTALLAFQAVRSGRVGVSGSTIEVLERSLFGLRDLADRSMSEARLDSGVHYKEPLRLASFMEAMEIDGSFAATNRDLKFSVERVDDTLLIDVDRHLFASAISNLLQNAFKFTRPFGHVWLRSRVKDERISIEIEDECGGLMPGTAEAIFQPFVHGSADRSGLGLGLAISRQAIEMDGGTISLRDIPGKGCIFVIEMPLVAAGATSSSRIPQA
jgi:signal transduction histidine kinase